MEKGTAEKVLLSVCAIAKPGEYVILNRSELASNLPNDYRNEDVDKAMLQLQGEDYVSVRYSDGDVYCLSVLTKGFVYGEKLKEEEEKRKEDESKEKDKTFIPGTEIAATEDAAASAEDAEKAVAVVQGSVKFPWKRLFLVCAGSSFLGGVIAGIVAFLLAKIA